MLDYHDGVYIIIYKFNTHTDGDADMNARYSNAMKTKTVVISGGNPGDMSVGIWPEEIDVTITYPAVMGDEEVFMEFMTEAVAAYLDTSEKRVTVSQYKPPQCVAMLTPD